MEYCLLFAGQSIQEEGMGAELWRHAPAREILKRLMPSLGEDLEDITTRMPDHELMLTVNAQRAIHASHLGHWFTFRAYHPGIALNGVIGHSVGIVAALVAAGVLSVEDSGVFVRERANAFATLCGELKEPRALAAVISDDLEELLDRIEVYPGIEVALHNTVSKCVIGGRVADLDAFAETAAREGWPLRVKPLSVEGPFHTALFKGVRERLSKVLEGMVFRRAAVPVFMGTSGQSESDPSRIKELLLSQPYMRERHLEAVQAAYTHGCRHFLEVAKTPQPVFWLGEQLLKMDGNPLPDVTASAVRTEEIEEPLVDA